MKILQAETKVSANETRQYKSNQKLKSCVSDYNHVRRRVSVVVKGYSVNTFFFAIRDSSSGLPH